MSEASVDFEVPHQEEASRKKTPVAAEIYPFPSDPNLLEKRAREARITAAIEQYADVFQVLVNRMCSVLEMQEARLRDGLKTGTSRAFSHDEEELARVREELRAAKALSKAMKG